MCSPYTRGGLTYVNQLGRYTTFPHRHPILSSTNLRWYIEVKRTYRTCCMCRICVLTCSFENIRIVCRMLCRRKKSTWWSVYGGVVCCCYWIIYLPPYHLRIPTYLPVYDVTWSIPAINRYITNPIIRI